jgi:hypothetical protein
MALMLQVFFQIWFVQKTEVDWTQSYEKQQPKLLLGITLESALWKINEVPSENYFPMSISRSFGK